MSRVLGLATRGNGTLRIGSTKLHRPVGGLTPRTSIMGHFGRLKKGCMAFNSSTRFTRSLTTKLARTCSTVGTTNFGRVALFRRHAPLLVPVRWWFGSGQGLFVVMGTTTGVGLVLSIIKGLPGNCRDLFVVVRSMDYCSAIHISEANGGNVGVVSSSRHMPGSRGGVTCGTTRTFFSCTNVSSENVRVRVNGGVPVTTNLTNKDTSNTKILCVLGELCGANFSRFALYSVNRGIKTSMPFSLANKADLYISANNIVTPLPTVSSYFVILYGPSVNISAIGTCGRVSRTRHVHRTSHATVLCTVGGHSATLVCRGVGGIFRRIVRMPGHPCVGRAVGHYNTGTTLVDKDKPAMFNVFASRSRTQLYFGGLGVRFDRACLAEPMGENVRRMWG